MKTSKFSLRKALICVLITLTAFTVIPGGLAQASDASALCCLFKACAPAPVVTNHELCVYYYTNTNPGPVAYFYDTRGTKAQGNGYVTSVFSTNINTIDHTAYAVDKVMNKGLGPYTAKAANMEFVGWNTKMDGTGIMVYPGQKIFADAKLPRTLSQNLYAIWKPTLSLTYDPNGGFGKPIVRFDSVGNVFTVDPLIDFSRENYGFEGWNTKPDGSGISYGAGAKITLTESLTLYAQYYPIKVG